jgi:molybdate transport system ATP-binding protein
VGVAPGKGADLARERRINPFLRRVKDETQLPMLYVSHARAEVEYLADRTLWMEAGCLLP